MNHKYYLCRITPNDYQRRCMRTAPTNSHSDLIENGVMGMCGEAGEAIDIVKKYLYQGHELDKDHLILELGDVLWYVATCAEGLNVSLEEVMVRNIEKLQKRYKTEFTAEESIHRAEGDI